MPVCHGGIVGMYASQLPERGFEHAGDGGRLTLPFLGGPGERPAASRRERVVFRAPAVLSRSPLSGDFAIPLETPERGEERTGVDTQSPAADLLQPYTNAVAMHRLEGERPEDQHVERALHE